MNQLSTISKFGAKLQSLYFFLAKIAGKVYKKHRIIKWISPLLIKAGNIHPLLIYLLTELSTVKCMMNVDKL